MNDFEILAGLLEPEPHLHQDAGDKRAAHQRGADKEIAADKAAPPAGT
jgi:hypothetical protein